MSERTHSTSGVGAPNQQPGVPPSQEELRPQIGPLVNLLAENRLPNPGLAEWDTSTPWGGRRKNRATSNRGPARHFHIRDECNNTHFGGIDAGWQRNYLHSSSNIQKSQSRDCFVAKRREQCGIRTSQPEWKKKHRWNRRAYA
jgi:hypothetical protein